LTAQRCFIPVLGVPEQPVPKDTSRRGRAASCDEARPRRPPPRPRRARQKSFAYLEPWLPPMTEAWNPEKVSLRESESWGLRPDGWDTGRPTVRAHCEPVQRPCPHCNELVHMTAIPGDDPQDGDPLPIGLTAFPANDATPAQAYIACPICKGRVQYITLRRRPDDEEDPGVAWTWAKFDPAGYAAMDEAGRAYNDIRGLSHCRPCVWSSCSAHLYLWVNDVGSIRFNHADVLPEQLERLKATCALDVSDDDTNRDERRHLALEKVGAYLGMTLERARQLEKESLATLRATRANEGIAPEDAPLFEVSADALRRPRKG
jgi:hypothetical protein